MSGTKQIGWGATCGRHRDSADAPTAVCKKQITYGKEALSDDECVLRLKRWLVMGLRIDNTDPSGRSIHLAHDARSLNDGLTLEELEAAVRALPP